jgi:alpha-L-rhamnosidase
MRKLFLGLCTAAIASAAPAHLRCDHLSNPLGIDSARPQLSWQSENAERNWRQSAYQILVATSPARLHKPDVWDSGKQSSADSNGIVYAGPTLESRRRYYWTVRVWDSKGRPAEPRQPAWFEMGLLAKDDWKAKWITRRDIEDENERAAIRWIWVAGQDAFHVAAKTAGIFRLNFTLRDDPVGAELLLLARGDYTATVNGRVIDSRRDAQEFQSLDAGEYLTAGTNSIEVTVTRRAQITALAALLKIHYANSIVDRFPTGDRWEARLQAEGTNWKPAAMVAGLWDQRLGDPPLSAAASLLRRSFDVAKPVRAARLYITALGSYQVFLNGQRVGNSILTPDWTDYRKRVLYQTYDVTGLVSRGNNVIGAILGDGWYGSGLGSTGLRFNFGPPPSRLIAQLEIEDAQGGRETIATDGSWRTLASPILRSEIYAGETYDARLEQPGWNGPGYPDARWTQAWIKTPPSGVVSSQMSPTIQVTETLHAKNVSSPSEGVSIFDMGQNMVGWVRLKASGPAGTKIRLRFVETLKPDGTVYRDNLRQADATDTFILRGAGMETLEPHFTYHGFRYVEVTGYPGKPSLDAIAGQVFHTANEFTGKFTSSSAMVNQLWLNTMWGQRGNLESVPTDCPQRDERLGWMGDAQIFWRTASYNMDMAAFSHKWMHDVMEAQSPEGGYSDVSPRVMDLRDGAPAWGDAGVIVPWTTWRHYGDTRILDENWDAMQRWMNYIGSENPDFIRDKRRNNDFGDWVPAESTTPKDLIATAYWAYDAALMSQMARAIGKDTDAKRYADLFEKVRAAFQKKFIHGNGEVGNGSQTCYALALHMNLATDAQVPVLMDRLVKDIETRNWHLSTGFLGTPYLLAVLVNNGRVDVAYRLLLNETYPSWGYMIGKGATTIWERWNGDHGDPGMNSFNHYAFGSVVEWLYRYAGGIDTAPDSPGFRNIVIHPRPDARFTHARAEYDSIYGKIVSDWNGAPNGPFALKVTIPANTTATVYLPGSATTRVTESGKPVDVRPGPAGYVTCAIGSGSYQFQTQP